MLVQSASPVKLLLPRFEFGERNEKILFQSIPAKLEYRLFEGLPSSVELFDLFLKLSQLDVALSSWEDSDESVEDGSYFGIVVSISLLKLQKCVPCVF